MKRTVDGQRAKIGDAALAAKTGKTWQQWFKILDTAKAMKMKHPEIASYLHDEQGCPDWWAQMITVGYEQERGLREKHQKPDGYSVSASKTIAVPIADLYAAWDDPKIRQRWLPLPKLNVRKATPNRSIRIAWDSKSNVVVMFYPKGDGKSQVSVEHNKLANAKLAQKYKACWAKSLEQLKEVLEA